MSKRMGYLMIVLGVLIAVWGIVLVTKKEGKEATTKKVVIERIVEKTENESQTVGQPAVASPSPQKVEKSDEPKVEEPNAAEPEDNFAKGEEFEKFVVKKFSPRYFRLQEWRSDKYVDGRYAESNHYPDLEVTFEMKSREVKERFAIECKWRKSFFKNRIEWAKGYQLSNYQHYAKDLNIPVWVVIGVGGVPSAPEEVYVMPLTTLTSPTVSKEELQEFRKSDLQKGFFWDYEANALR